MQNTKCKMQNAKCRTGRRATGAQRLGCGARLRAGLTLSLNDELRPAPLNGKPILREKLAHAARERAGACIGGLPLDLSQSAAANYEKFTLKNAADYKSGRNAGSIAVVNDSDTRNVLRTNDLRAPSACLHCSLAQQKAPVRRFTGSVNTAAR
jgi:hypothetical protein